MLVLQMTAKILRSEVEITSRSRCTNWADSIGIPEMNVGTKFMVQKEVLHECFETTRNFLLTERARVFSTDEVLWYLIHFLYLFFVLWRVIFEYKIFHFLFLFFYLAYFTSFFETFFTERSFAEPVCGMSMPIAQRTEFRLSYLHEFN